MSEKACRECHFISYGSICPKCKSTSLSDDFSGLVIIFEPKDSSVANSMNAEVKGRYALRVR